MDWQRCNEELLPFASPVADLANRLLRVDPKHGDQGLLVRTIDRQFDSYNGTTKKKSIEELLHDHDVYIKPPLPPLYYLPSSYLHASMRAPGAFFEDGEFQSFSIMVGTKFANNTSMERFQTQGKSVGCDYVYPTDGTSIERASLLGPDYCETGRLPDVCVDGECIAHGPKTCGGCKVKPEDYGDLVSRWSEKVLKDKLIVPWYVACYYESFQDAVVASNSMYQNLERWSVDPNPLGYIGYTECGSPVRIGEVDMADAIIMPLHRTDDIHTPQTACHHPDHHDLERRFIMAHERGYGDHPVLWYRESAGTVDLEECWRLFKGKSCKEAWHKEFFSQEFDFPNHSCVHKPPGCDEAYFFPADGERCSAHTKTGKNRIARLCRVEKDQDARLAWEGMLEKERLDSFLLTGRGPHQPKVPPPPLPSSMRRTKSTAIRNGQGSAQSPPFWLVNLGCMLVGCLAPILLCGRRKNRCIHIKIRVASD